MTAGNQEILLTSQDVQLWRDRKAELEREIADAQRELAEIDRNLEAVGILLKQKGSADVEAAAEISPADELEEDDGFGSPVAG